MLQQHQKKHVPLLKALFPLSVVYLRVSLEVSLVKRLEVALVRACGRGLASWWDSVGEVGGAEYTGGPRSLSCPPWKVLRIVEPRVRRHLSEEDDEAAPAPEMLSVDGDAVGMRWPRELHSRDRRDRKKWKCDFEIFTYVVRIPSLCERWLDNLIEWLVESVMCNYAAAWRSL